MVKNILIGTVLVLVMIASAGATEVRVSPTSQTVTAGDPFHVNITVEGVVDGMRAYDVVLNFDHSAMQVKKTCGMSGNEFCFIEGAFLQTGGSTLGFAIVDNTAGTVKIGYALLGDYSPVTGDGILGTVEFETYPDAPAGIYDLNLMDVILIDASDVEIPADISNGMVTILSPPTTATPTPTRTSTRDGGGSGIVIFDATGEGTADVNITDTISSTPATTTPTTTTTPDTIPNVSANATTDRPAPAQAATPSSVPGLNGTDVIAASGMLAIIFAIRKRKQN